jgi:hypothetical protein
MAGDEVTCFTYLAWSKSSYPTIRRTAAAPCRRRSCIVTVLSGYVLSGYVLSGYRAEAVTEQSGAAAASLRSGRMPPGQMALGVLA